MEMCKQDSSVLHAEEMYLLREWVEDSGAKIPLATHKTKSEEHTKEEKPDTEKAEENIKTNKLPSEGKC